MKDIEERVAFTATEFPFDRRRKWTNTEMSFPRKGLKIGFSVVLQHYKVFCDEGFATITYSEYERLKNLGIEVDEES